MDLFDWRPPQKPTYPDRPGYKQHTTSKDAADAMEPRAPGLRDRALAALRAAGASGLTPDEVAERMGCTVLAIRPRITELKLAELIVKTGERRANISGAKADVWRAVHEQ